MRISRLMATMGCLFVLAAAWSAAAAPPQVIWNSPSADSRGSMPIGNGDIGANVWVDPGGDLLFYLSKTDAWDESCRLIKLGRIRVHVEPAIDMKNVKFTQTLDPVEGVIHNEIVTTDGHKLITRFWIDANAPIVHVDIDSDPVIGLRATAEVMRPARRELVGGAAGSAYGLHGAGGPKVFEEADTVVKERGDFVSVYHRNERSIWADNMQLQALGDEAAKMIDPLMHRTFGYAMRGDGLARADDTALASTSPRSHWSLQIAALTDQTDSDDAYIAKLRGSLKTASQQDEAAAWAAHTKWWRAFWNRSWIEPAGDADAERVSQAYALQRWVNACGGRGAMPIKFNGSIFTMDTNGYGADFRLWGGPYWWQNTRLMYWPMLAAGDDDLMQPLFKMYHDALPLREAATRKYYDHDGAFYPETMYFWGTYTDANYGRNRTRKPDGLTDNGYIRRYWQGGIEQVMMMLDYYDYTGDAAFRDQTLLPMAIAITTFFDQHWPRNEQSRIVFEPAQALETYWTAKNPMPEVAGLHAVLPRLMALPVGDDQRATWAAMLKALPPVPTIQRGGKPALAPGASWSNGHNIENPELYAVFPYRLYTRMQGGDKLETALNTWPARRFKATGCWRQDAIQAALLGLSDEAARLALSNAKATARGHRFMAFWGNSFDWTPDEDHGGVTMEALQLMAIQTDGKRIFVLPAWPRKWDVDFKLHAPMQTTVQVRYEGGKIVELKVEPAERVKDVVLPEELSAPGE
ncbi:MAG: hypothetical protein GC162_21020 [Planctomycetes bacterium]|nr:hypothetical protein [Planctomycetota bacterium]